MIEAGDSLFGFKGNSQTWLVEDVPMHGDPWASYDAWKPTPPDWVMPFHTRRYADETRWRMHRDLGRHPFFDGDESEYEYLCEEWDELARIDAHERAPEEEDFEEMTAATGKSHE